MPLVIEEIWSDLHHSIIADAQGKLKKVINIKAVETSIHNILNTSRGERIMLRDFGSNLKSMLFENINDDLTNLVADDIKEAINRWDNRIIINSINFKTNADRNTVTVSIHFSVRGYDEIFSMNTTV